LVKGFNQALAKSTAKFAYIVNLMTHYSQTHQMSANDHLTEVTRYFGRQPDYVVVNNGPISPELLKLYATEKEYPVKNNLSDNGPTKIIHGDFVAQVAIRLDSNDEVRRSLLRHDADKLATCLTGLI
jgi:2-phospho-L-lactate transferase/gluconeogenesis factor (CofD/UPF0052 family)